MDVSVARSVDVVFITNQFDCFSSNGNEVSKIYAGTGAIGSIGAGAGSKIIDGARSAARTIQNNLLDSSKQEAIDILLVGSTLSSELADRARILLPTNMLHAPTPVLREMCKRYSEYITPAELRVAIGTYNVNGGKHFRSVVYKDLSLIDWLAPKNGKKILMLSLQCRINYDENFCRCYHRH